MNPTITSRAAAPLGELIELDGRHYLIATIRWDNTNTARAYPADQGGAPTSGKPVAEAATVDDLIHQLATNQ